MTDLRVATCQFPVRADPRVNARWIARQMAEAKDRGAAVAHFPECALSGYAGVDFASHDLVDWAAIRGQARELFAAARRLRLWLVLGSAHPLTGKRKPLNSLYLVDDRGRLAERYDKRFVAGSASGRDGELRHFTPGRRFVPFVIGGVRCAALICHEVRYPELFREAASRGVRLVFHSFHAGHADRARWRAMQQQVGARHHSVNAASTLPGIVMPASIVAAAGSNHLWISAANTSARESCFGACFVRPDGVVTGRLPRNRAGVLISSIDADAIYYDSTRAWRGRAMRGRLHSGTPVEDPREAERRRL